MIVDEEDMDKLSKKSFWRKTKTVIDKAQILLGPHYYHQDKQAEDSFNVHLFIIIILIITNKYHRLQKLGGIYSTCQVILIAR